MDVQQILTDLNQERNRLDQAIAALEGLYSHTTGRRGRPPGAKQATAAPTRKSGGISPEGRRLLSEMMKKRWAERKKKAAPKRKPMSAASRKRLSDMMKKRWLERKKAKAA
ncbi:MAG: hypothetical protein WCC92_04525 [Candidatus Korobacteraceae bacterium]